MKGAYHTTLGSLNSRRMQSHAGGDVVDAISDDLVGFLQRLACLKVPYARLP